MGPHIETFGCVLYGVMEVEAAFNFPTGNAAFFFSSLYGAGASHNNAGGIV